MSKRTLSRISRAVRRDEHGNVVAGRVRGVKRPVIESSADKRRRREQATGATEAKPRSRTERPLLVFGIDPGVHTGVTEYDPVANRIVRTLQTTFWGAYELITHFSNQFSTLIVIEDCRAFPTVRQSDDRRKQDRMSRNVGAVQREGELLARGLERAGFTVYREKPATSKWTMKMFRQVTGYDGPVTQHEVDSARLAWGWTRWPNDREDDRWPE